MNTTRLRAAVGLAVAQLRHYRVRMALAAVGIALAVVLTVVLVSLGVSVLALGDAGFERIGGDLWVTASGTGFAPGTVGGVDNQLVDAHETTREINEYDGVSSARAVAFQTVYVGTEPGEYDTVIGAGVTGGGGPFNIEAGETFSGGDEHYADGEYDGAMSNEVLIDRRIAEATGVGVGDTLHIGGTVVAADENEFTVVGVSNDISRSVGAPTVVLHLAELQTVSSTTATDPATAIVIALDDDADSTALRDELDAAYPELTVRTSEGQFESVLREQSAVIASAVTLVALAVGGGIALVANLFGLLVYQQRRQLAALKASGVSSRTLLSSVFFQGLAIGLAGAALGLAAVVPGVEGINAAVSYVIGFDDVISVPLWAAALGLTLALVVGLLGALAAAWLVVRVSPLRHLPR